MVITLGAAAIARSVSPSRAGRRGGDPDGPIARMLLRSLLVVDDDACSFSNIRVTVLRRETGELRNFGQV